MANEKEAVQLPKDLVDEVKTVVEQMGFSNVEEYAECAVRRLLDKHRLLLKTANTMSN